MTLQQLKYVVATAEKGTVSEAAQSLFISQPSLTNAIRELEKEMNITIFIRTNKGITVSKDGEIFLGYARCLNRRAFLKKNTAENNTAKGSFAYPLSITPLR